MISSLGIPVPVAVLIVALVPWLVFVLLGLRRAQAPHEPRRTANWPLVASSLMLAVVWVVALGGFSDLTREEAVSTAAVTRTGAVSQATCASIRTGMGTREVRETLGEPDEIVNEEQIRGPDAEQWTYRASRCSIHLVNEEVQFIE